MSRPEAADLSTLVHEWKLNDPQQIIGVRLRECEHCGLVVGIRRVSLCLARVEQERRKAFEAGYKTGQHHESGGYSDPEEAYEQWVKS